MIASITVTSTSTAPSRLRTSEDISSGTDDALGMRRRERGRGKAEDAEEAERGIGKARRGGDDRDQRPAAIGLRTVAVGSVVELAAGQRHHHGRPAVHALRSAENGPR